MRMIALVIELAKQGHLVPGLPNTWPRTKGQAGGRIEMLLPLRILVVEDEGLLALEAKIFLERDGHTVVGTADTRTAAVLHARAARPDLALVDLRLLDGNSGLALAADLGALGIPVLFATSNCPEEVGQGLAIGCLHKPFDEGQLLATIAVAARVLQGQAVDRSVLPSNLHLYG